MDESRHSSRVPNPHHLGEEEDDGVHSIEYHCKVELGEEEWGVVGEELGGGLILVSGLDEAEVKVLPECLHDPPLLLSPLNGLLVELEWNFLTVPEGMEVELTDVLKVSEARRDRIQNILRLPLPNVNLSLDVTNEGFGYRSKSSCSKKNRCNALERRSKN